MVFEPPGGRQRWLPGPLPEGMTARRFGELIGWGTGDAEARVRIGHVDVPRLRAAGMTSEMIVTWTEGYRKEKAYRPENPSAQGRVELLESLLPLFAPALPGAADDASGTR